MVPVSDFDMFYDTKILPVLGKVKAMRQKMKNWEWGCIVSMVFTIGNFAGCQVSEEGQGSTFGSMAAAGGFCLAICISQYARCRDEYLDTFKETCIREILNFLIPGVTYRPGTYVPSKEYRRSGLFRRRYDAFDGEDYIEGTYKEVRFRCSEINTSFNKANNVNEDIFNGLFFIANISPIFQSVTYVWPNGDEQAMGLEDIHHRYFPIPEVKHMRTENKSFEQYYSVYSASREEADYLLGGDLMNQLVRYRRQIKKPISVSFVKNKCYVAIPLEKNLFEPNHRDPGDKETVKEYFFSVLLILSIINQLHLSRLT